GDGALYDPAHDTWTPIAAVGAPKPRFDHLLAWTGDRLLVWGGAEQGSMDPVLLTGPKQFLGDGGLYDPVAKTGTAIPPGSVPGGHNQLEAYHALWSGDRLFVLENGSEHAYVYDPNGSAWTEIPSPNQNGGCEHRSDAQAGALVAICAMGMGRAAFILAPG